MFRRNQSILWTELSGQVAMLCVERGRYFEANALGGVIWRLLEEPRSTAEIVEYIVSRYRVDREQCSKDLLKFLGEMTASGLVMGEAST